MKSSRITQILLAALVITQVPNLVSFVQALSRYESPESALRACKQWAESAGRYSVTKAGPWTSTRQYPLRSCKKEGDQFVGYEVPLEGASELSERDTDPRGFMAGSVPEAQDTGKRWRFRRKQWSLVIPF